MKIRFYHWWIYKLYYRIWGPIYEYKPWLLREIVKEEQAWLEQLEAVYQARRKKLRVLD